jgi:CRISPR-associated endonuclease/helicase Cas3
VDLKKLWAKSDGTTLEEHNSRLLKNLETLKSMFGDLIENCLDKKFRNTFWKALELACIYHDYGKAHAWFQKKVGNPNYRRFQGNFPEVKHNLLSPAFLPKEADEDLRTLIALAIVHHHDYEPSQENAEKVEEVLQKEFQKDIDFIHKKVLIVREEEILEKLGREKFGNFYILLKGFLLRIDHASSSRFADNVETNRLESTESEVEKYLKEHKKSEFNDLQEFVLKERDSNLIVTASTGYGKTEAGFIFLKDKGFFTIPIRTSANAIYERAKEVFGDNKVGLLHSTSSLYLIGNSEESRNFNKDTVIKDLYLTKNFAKPLIVSTPDQLFPFILRPRGFEKYMSLFSYARVVIDEVQLFEPHTLGFLVKAIEKIQTLGGKVMVMTATLPSYVREDLKNVEFREGVFISSKIRHNLKMIKSPLISKDALDLVKKLSKEGKVLVITNTRRIALKLREALGEGEVLHAYFIYKDRKKKEEEIKKFFDTEKRGIWITTQVAEVSLDLDADFLVTELSTADSLLQRMGRVNRKGEKPIDSPNVFVFTEDCSGIGTVYRKSIHELTKRFLKEGKLDEEEKFQLVEKVYFLLKEQDKEYMNIYEQAKRYIDSLWELKDSFSKRKAQELFRDIMSLIVIPEIFKDEVKEIIKRYVNETDPFEKLRLYSEILSYTFSFSPFDRASLCRIKEFPNVYWIKGDYQSELGFLGASEEDYIV